MTRCAMLVWMVMLLIVAVVSAAMRRDEATGLGAEDARVLFVALPTVLLASVTVRLAQARREGLASRAV